MPIKVEPFINPFRESVKNNNDGTEVITHKGKTYTKVVRKR